MNAGRYILSQILDLIHWQTLTRLVAKYEPDSKHRHFGFRQQFIRRGWHLGTESFKDKLLRMLEEPAPSTAAGSHRVAGAERDRSEKEALRILREGSRALSLPPDTSGLEGLRKTDPRKVQLAILLRTHTAVSNKWVAEKLAMGHPGSVSRAVSEGRSRKEPQKLLKKLGNMLIGVL